MPVAVVKDREQETLCLTRTGSGCDECVLRMMPFLCGQFPEGLDLVSVWREARLDDQRNFSTFLGSEERGLEGDVRTLDEPMLRVLDEFVESLMDITVLELIRGAYELKDGFLDFECLLEREHLLTMMLLKLY